MRFDQRIVAQLPLRQLWNEHGVVSETSVRELSARDVAELLRGGRARFVVANVGRPLKWVPADECYGFWKSEAKGHLADPAAENCLGSFPDEYLYFATEWEPEEGEPIILLTMHH